MTTLIAGIPVEDLAKLLPRLIYNGAVCIVTRNANGTYTIEITKVLA